MKPDLKIYNLGTDGYGRLIQTFKGELYDGLGLRFDLSPLICDYVQKNPDSLSGPQGSTGLDGKDGIGGVQGSQGVQGPQGLTGQDGEDGIDGTQGPQGVQGPQGSQGVQGPHGPQGDSGPTGHMDILIDVTYPIGGPTDGDFLQYNNSGQWVPVSGNRIEVFFNFEVADSFGYIVPYDLVFATFSTNVSMTASFLLGTFSYSFGTPLDRYDVLTVVTDTAGLITLEGERL